ncbi:Peroxisomal membrane protein PMP22-like protein [Drosera capensis]
MGSSSMAKKGFQHYMWQLQHHPLRTKAITAGVLSGVSDVVSQKLSGIQKIQLRRILLKVLFGAAYLGPFGHFFHMLLDKIFMGKKDKKTVAKKVLIEQITASPLNNILFMLYYGAVVEGKSFYGMLEATKPGNKHIEETISISTVDSMDVLARSGMDQPPVCSFATAGNLPQLGCFWLGNFLESASEVYDINQSLRQQRTSVASSSILHGLVSGLRQFHYVFLAPNVTVLL